MTGVLWFLGVIAVLAAVFLLPLRFIARGGAKGPREADQGGVFGGIPNIAPGMFDPGSGNPITYEATEHVRAYDESEKKSE